ncbi:MAG: Rne/Rng family ribonuclease [Phycisphaerae bacterium]
MKKVKKTTRRKRAAGEEESPPIQDMVATDAPTSAAENAATRADGAAAPKTTRTRRGRRGGKGRGRGKAKSEQASVTSPAPPAEPEPRTIERTDSGVVIRFPPIGVPPPTIGAPAEPARAAPPAPRESPTVHESRTVTLPHRVESAAPSGRFDDRPLPSPHRHDRQDWQRTPHARRDEPSVPGGQVSSPSSAPGRDQSPLEETRREHRRDGARRPHPPRDEPRRDGRPPQDEFEFGPDGKRLTPSQKRRLRRRRRAQQRRQEREAQAAGLTPQATNESPTNEPLEDAADIGPGDEPTMYDADAGNGVAEPIGGLELVDGRDATESVDDEIDEARAAEASQDVAGPAPTALPEDQPRQQEGRRRRRRGRRRGRFGDRDSDGADSRTFEARDAEMVTFDESGESEAGAIEVREIDEPADEESGEETPPRPRATKREMIINVVPREECRIAIVEDDKLEEIYLERASAENHVGNIYKGIVTNVEASIQAAFIDFGLGKNGFLHISDLHPQYFPHGDGQTENVGRKLPRRARPPIQRCLRRGQELMVQITKEGIGTKGPTLTTYLSIPGRFLVMMPGMRKLGVSRKIEDDDLRDRLKDAMSELELPADMGFIARTAAVSRTKRELQSDLTYLSRLWRSVSERIQSERPPAELYRETDLVIRTIRDVFTSDIERIIVDDRDVAERAREFLNIFSPRSRDAVVEYDGPEPIFHKYGIETELERLHSRHVPLKSGGSLVIDQTEALVAIDVNSGRYRAEDDAETTAYKMNLEAADEIPRQLRLRDLGGVIICDFIDMRIEKHRREVERRLVGNLKQHKERAKVLRMSQFGIIEMTRQRQRASLTRSVYQDCQHCRGTGLVKTTESVTLDVMRLIQLAVVQEHIRVVEVTVSPEVATLLQNRKRSQLHQLESEHRRTVAIRSDAHYGLDQVQVQCFDARGRLVPHA